MSRLTVARFVAATLSVVVAQPAILSTVSQPAIAAHEPLWINAGSSEGVYGPVQISIDSSSISNNGGVTTAFLRITERNKPTIRKVSFVCSTGKIAWGDGNYNDPRSYPVRQAINIGCTPGMSK